MHRVLGDGPLIAIARKCEEVQPQRCHAQRRGAQISLGVPVQRHRQRDQRDPDPYVQEEPHPAAPTVKNHHVDAARSAQNEGDPQREA
ncbi:hypothetical protein SDC9_158157 [bioreactor metagenome]|uniref:Uncharacterized protein n=1 Tax=bioreactor metagenome TaxID=1076179 RepID=A0A645FAD2_9ZZZZ